MDTTLTFKAASRLPMHSNVVVVSLVSPDEHLGVYAVESGIGIISLVDATVRRRLHTQVEANKSFSFSPDSKNG